VLVTQCKEEKPKLIQTPSSENYSTDKGLVDMSRSSNTKLTSVGIKEVS